MGSEQGGPRCSCELWFMLAIARAINWPATLAEMIERGAWPDALGFAPNRLTRVLEERAARSEQVYTGAYMIRAENDPATLRIGGRSTAMWPRSSSAGFGRIGRGGARRSNARRRCRRRGSGSSALAIGGEGRSRPTRSSPIFGTPATYAGRPLKAPVGDPVGEMRALLAAANGVDSPLAPWVPRPLEMRDKYLRVKHREGRPRARFAPRPRTLLDLVN